MQKNVLFCLTPQPPLKLDIIYVHSLVVFLHIEQSDDKEWIWEIRAKHQDLFAKVEFDSDDTDDDSDDTDDDSDDSDDE